MTHPHSPLPWTVRQEGAIFDADGVPVISDDGALYPEDRDLIVTAVNNHEKMRKALDFYADPISWQTKGHPQIDAFDTPAINDKGALARAALAGE